MDEVDFARQLWKRNRGNTSVSEDDFVTQMSRFIRHLKLFGFDPSKVREWYRSQSKGSSGRVFNDLLAFTDRVDINSLTAQTCGLIKRKYTRLLVADIGIAALFALAFSAKVLSMMGVGSIPEEAIRHLKRGWVFGFVCVALVVTLGRIAHDIYQILRAARAPVIA